MLMFQKIVWRHKIMIGNRYGGIFINCFTADLLKNQPVKEF